MKIPSDKELLGVGVATLVALIIVLAILWSRDTQAGATYHRVHHPVSNYTSLEKYELLLRR